MNKKKLIGTVLYILGGAAAIGLITWTMLLEKPITVNWIYGTLIFSFSLLTAGLKLNPPSERTKSEA